MAVLDDLSKVVDAVDKLSKDGLPIVVEHQLEKKSVWNTAFALMAVALVFVALLGVKDLIVKRL
jgi:hypothetical protein